MVHWTPPTKTKITNQDLVEKSKELLMEWMESKDKQPASTWTEGEVRNFKEILRVALADGAEGKVDIIEDVPLDNLLDIFNAEKAQQR